MDQGTFRVDPVAFSLKEGERVDVEGLVLVVGWSWGSDTSTGYTMLARDISSLGSDTLLVYGKQHLHCTVATLSRRVMNSYHHADTTLSPFYASLLLGTERPSFNNMRHWHELYSLRDRYTFPLKYLCPERASTGLPNLLVVS